MRRNLKLCIRSLRREWIDFFAKAIQMGISVLLLGLLINSYVEQEDLLRQVGALQGEKSLYVLRDNNTDAYWNELISSRKYTRAFVRLTETVLEMDTELVVMNNVMAVNLNDNEVEVIEVTPNFFEKYGLSGSFDKKALSTEFKIQKGEWESTDVIEKPAILGGAYQTKYSLGERFTDDSGRPYRVAGFLDRHQFYAAPVQGPEMNPLDTAIITPVYVNEEDNASMYFFLYGCQFLTDDASELERMLQINREERLLDTWVQSYDAQLQNVKATYTNAAVMEGVLGVTLFLFAFMGMLCSMILRIDDHAYEYAVNLLCGARMKEIFFRIIFEYVVIMYAGDAVCFAVFGTGTAFILAMFLTFVCMTTICAFARHRIRSANLTENLRSRG